MKKKTKKKKPGRARFEKAEVTHLKSNAPDDPRARRLRVVKDAFPESLYVEREEDITGDETTVTYVADVARPTGGNGRIIAEYKLVCVSELKVSVTLEPI